MPTGLGPCWPICTRPHFGYVPDHHHQQTPSLAPHVLSLDGLEEAFWVIYPAEQVSERLQAIQKLAASLTGLAGNSEPSKLVTVDELQALSCSALPSPCWIYWKYFYLALDPHGMASILMV